MPGGRFFGHLDFRKQTFFLLGLIVKGGGLVGLKQEIVVQKYSVWRSTEHFQFKTLIGQSNIDFFPITADF